MHSSSLDVFGVGWTAVFDQDGRGPRSDRWLVTRQVIDGELASVTFSASRGDLYTWSGGSAREVAEAILASLDVAADAPHEPIEAAYGDGPDDYRVRGVDAAGEPSIEAAKGWKMGAFFAARRIRTMSGGPMWSLDHLPTGRQLATFDLFATARAAAEQFSSGHARRDFDLSVRDAAALVAQEAFRAIGLSIDSEENRVSRERDAREGREADRAGAAEGTAP